MTAKDQILAMQRAAVLIDLGQQMLNDVYCERTFGGDDLTGTPLENALALLGKVQVELWQMQKWESVPDDGSNEV